jgi:hypothetical protein
MFAITTVRVSSWELSKDGGEKERDARDNPPLIVRNHHDRSSVEGNPMHCGVRNSQPDPIITAICGNNKINNFRNSDFNRCSLPIFTH